VDGGSTLKGSLSKNKKRTYPKVVRSRRNVWRLDINRMPE
jgi:hypothetical protein